MARSISSISQSLKDMFVSFGQSVGLVVTPDYWSEKDYKGLMIDTFSEGTGIFEQILDASKADMEAIRAKAVGGTKPWIQDKFLNLFEYDATATPIVQLDISGSEPTFAPFYTNPNPNFRVVKFCSVVPGYQGTTLIKIAVAGPAKASNSIISAAQSFIDIIGVPGIRYTVQSSESDKLFMQLDVYYNGLYDAVIQSTVIAAINTYLSTIGFDGTIVLSDLLIAIKKVAGVNDVVFGNVKARANTQTVGLGTSLVSNYLEVSRNYQTQGGYIIPETTTGANWTLTDYRIGASGIKNLNLIPQ